MPCFQYKAFKLCLWVLWGFLSGAFVVTGASWTWTGASGGSWSTGANWSPSGVPTSALDTVLNFSNATTSSINNIGGTFTLNQLNFGVGIGTPYTLSGNALQFGGTAPQFNNLNAVGVINVTNAITLGAATKFTGASASRTLLSGAISGANALTIDTGTVTFSNAANSFAGGLNVTGGGTVMVSQAVPINISSVGNSYLGAGTVSATGGNIVLRTTGANDLTISRNMSFSSGAAIGTKANLFESGRNLIVNAGAVSVTNGAQLNVIASQNLFFNPTATTIDTGGLLSIQATAGTSNLTGNTFTFGAGGGTLMFNALSGLSNGVGSVIVNTTGLQQAVIENTRMNNSASAQGWIASTIDDNYLAINNGSVTGTGNLTYKMSNGGLILDYQTSYGGAITLQGFLGGNAAADSTAKNVGRFVFADGTFVTKGGLFFKDALQVTNAFSATILSSDLTVQSGETAFQGRATTASSLVAASRLTLGGSSVDTLTINSGATATMDLGFRTDAYATFVSGIILNANTIINGGGTLNFTQTVANAGSTYDVIEVNSPITGKGTEKTGEALLKLQDSIAVGSNLIFGPSVNLYVQGSGINGLRVEGNSTNVNALLTSTFFQSNVLSVGSPSTDQGTLTIAFTDNGSRTFTDADGPMDASYVRLGFDAPVNSKSIYTLESSGAKVGSLSHWNGLVVKGGTVQLGSDVVFKGATGAASLALTGGTLRLDDGAGTGHDLIFAGGADLRAGTIDGGPKGGLLTIMGKVVKTTSGTVSLNGRIAVTDSQGINIQAGTMSQLASDLIESSTNMTLSGGTYQLVGGASQTLGTLTLTASSTIDFGGGASILAFADSSGASWASGAILSIINWQGSPISGGGSAQLIFGGLTSSQLAQIKFIDPSNWSGAYNSIQVKSCEVVPVPEPSSVVAAIALGGFAGVFEWRRRRKRPLVAG